MLPMSIDRIRIVHTPIWQQRLIKSLGQTNLPVTHVSLPNPSSHSILFAVLRRRFDLDLQNYRRWFIGVGRATYIPPSTLPCQHAACQRHFHGCALRPTVPPGWATKLPHRMGSNWRLPADEWWSDVPRGLERIRGEYRGSIRGDGPKQGIVQ